jgi:two-component system cell cycle response regulator DivK
MPLKKRRSPTESLAVIVIEDDADARHIYSEYLRKQGCTVFTAPDGRAGLTKIDELTPDVIVLDLAMPRVDGWTVLKHVRESSLTSQIAVVVVSAVSDARDQAFYDGCDAYLMKPCLPDVLYLQIRALSRFQAAARSSRSFS